MSKDGISPFHLVAMMNYPEIFKFLLQLCPECCLVTISRIQNVLHLAVQENATGIMEFIVKDKKLNELLINDNDGNTPLHIAAYHDDEKMNNALLASLKTEKTQSRLLKAMEDFHSSLLVMATLITTVTFTAAFTMHGGYKSAKGPDQGMATLIGRAAFKVLLVSDAISMCSSIIITTALILFPVFLSSLKRFIILSLTFGSIAISNMFMLVAFAAGVWVVIGSECKWLAILIVVATTCTPLILILALRYIMVQFDKDEDWQ